jgi:RHS repeat-associated protein
MLDSTKGTERSVPLNDRRRAQFRLSLSTPRPTRWLGRVYFAGTCVGEVDSNGGWRLPSVDRLGSLKQGSRRYPFGDGNESYLFDEYATYRRDWVSAHYYAWNRYYSATWGRFSSPDPYVMSGGLTNPQGWNRYSYVANDPVNFDDPAGLHAQRPVVVTPPITVTAWVSPLETMMGTYGAEFGGAGWGDIAGGPSHFMEPEGAGGGGGPTPHQAASSIGAEVKAGRMTDCEGLAAFAKYAGQYYAGTTEEFVRSFGVFVDSGHPVVKVVNFLTGGAIASSPYLVWYKPFGESGFKSQYKDSLKPYQDQVHHFAAFFQFGYVAGALEGEIAAYLSDWNNPGDIDLGIKASEMGYAVKKGFMRAIDVWKRIQEILCK